MDGQTTLPGMAPPQPAELRSQPCRACGVAMRWARSAKTGKPIPLDAAPRPDGNILLDGDVARYLGKGEVVPAGALRWVSHFSTCPAAKQFRRL